MDLVVFTAVARTGSLGAAAAELTMSSPSVSARIAGLERHLKVRLLERGARGSTLTPAGERLLYYATRTLDLLDEAETNVPAHRVRRLVLAAPASLADVLFAPALTILAGTPVRAHCRVAHSGEVISRIMGGSVHAGFVIAKVPLRALSTEPLGRPPLVALARREHPLASRGRVVVDDLADTGVVVYRWGRDAQRLAALFELPHRRPGAPVHTTASPAAAIRLAADGGYVAVVPEFCAADPLHVDRLCRIPLALSGWSLDVQFVYAGEQCPPGVEVLLDNLPTLRATVCPDSRWSTG